MSGDAPEDWSRTTLGAVADITRGVSWRDENEVSKEVPGALPVLGIRNVQQSLQLDETVWLGGLSQRSVASSTVRSGDILMVGSNGNPARIGNAIQIDVPGVYLYASLLFGLRPDQASVDGQYLFHLVRSGPIQQAISQTVQGSTGLANLKITVLRNLEITLPPLEEQLQIAEVLRSVDKAIAANGTILEQMSRMRAATLYAAFEESAWEPIKLRDLGRWRSGGTPSKADASLWDGNVPWICPRDMKAPVVSRAESNVSAKAIGGSCKVAPKGTLLIVVRGMILAKAIPTATTAMDATFNQDIKAFYPNGIAEPKIIQLSLQHQEHGLLQLVNTATHGTKKLDADTLADVDVPLPDLVTQKNWQML